MLSLLHRFVPAHHSKNKRIKIISVCYLLMITDWNIHTQFHKLEKQDLKIMAKKSLYYMALKVNLKKKKKKAGVGGQYCMMLGSNGYGPTYVNQKYPLTMSFTWQLKTVCGSRAALASSAQCTSLPEGRRGTAGASVLGIFPSICRA